MKNLVIVRAPLRVSFVGGGSDLPGGSGRTVSTAIDKHVYAFVKRRHDGQVILNWRHKEVVADAGDLKHDLVREILVSEGLLNGVEITTIADVPGVGSGLGSSAATTCAVLAGVMALKGYNLEGERLAEGAAEIELGRLKGPGGRQDHYASALGGMLDINYADGQVDRWEHISSTAFLRRRLAEHFLLFSPKDASGRDSGPVLADTFHASGSSSDVAWREKCNQLCRDFKFSWGEGDYEDIGRLVSDHHNLKACQFKRYISPGLRNDLDWLKLPYKITGAGQMGHLLVASTPEHRDWDIAKIEKVWGANLPWLPVDYGTEVIYAE